MAHSFPFLSVYFPHCDLDLNAGSGGERGYKDVRGEHEGEDTTGEEVFGK